MPPVWDASYNNNLREQTRWHVSVLCPICVGGRAWADIALRGGAVHFVGVGPSVEKATEDAARRAVDFTVARTGLGREEAYMLLSIIGELRIGTSPRPVMATRLIVPEEGPCT